MAKYQRPLAQVELYRYRRHALTQMTQGDLGGDRGDRALGDVEVDPAAGGLRIDNAGSMSG
jgi:hypothetical protein